MAKIWDDIEITWRGKAYVVRPDINLLNSVEGTHGHSVMALMRRFGTGDVPMGISAEVIARVLRHAGVDADAEDVLNEFPLFSEGEDSIISVAGAIVGALVPKNPKHMENAPAGQAGTKKKTAAKRTGGKSTG